MARSSEKLVQSGTSLGSLFSFLLVLSVCGATPAPSSATAVGEVSGLSPYIVPVEQRNNIYIYYPGNGFTPDQDFISYGSSIYFDFECVQPTNRITFHGNDLWWMAGKQVTYKSADGTIVIVPIESFSKTTDPDSELEVWYNVDMEEDMQVGVKYTLLVAVGSFNARIENTDNYGIRAFRHDGNEGTDQVAFTIDFSQESKSIRRFIPCMDDPTISIPSTWTIVVYGGNLHFPAVAVMNGERTESRHVCANDRNFRSSIYSFELPKMPIGMTQLRIMPFSWYENDDVLPPSCI